MKINLIYLLKAVLIIAFLLMCVFPINATYIPMPIVFGNGNSGEINLTTDKLVALGITFNIPSLLIIIIRSLIWVIKRPDYTYMEYVWYSRMELITPSFNTYWLFISNGLVILIALFFWIESFF